MQRGDWATHQTRLWDASWEGVISVSDLVRLGVPERTAYRRTQQEGPWTLVLPATILLANGTPTPRQKEIAALLYAGPEAMLTGLSGARHHGLRRGGDPEIDHVLVPLHRQVLSSGRAVVERTRRPPTPVLRDGLPVAPIPRTLIDATRRIKDVDRVAAILTEGVQRRLVLPETLRAELELSSRKGSATPRRVLQAVDDNVRSAAEFAAREFWMASDLPEIAWNVPIHDESGRQVAVADGLVEECGFVWEIDSVAHHFTTPDQVERTKDRERRLRDLGLHVLSTRPTSIRNDAIGTRAEISAHLEIARMLPAPRARYGPSVA